MHCYRKISGVFKVLLSQENRYFQENRFDYVKIEQNSETNFKRFFPFELVKNSRVSNLLFELPVIKLNHEVMAKNVSLINRGTLHAQQWNNISMYAAHQINSNPSCKSSSTIFYTLSGLLFFLCRQKLMTAVLPDLVNEGPQRL